MSPRKSNLPQGGWRPLSIRLLGPPVADLLAGGLPKSLFGFVWAIGPARQYLLLGLSLMVAALDAAPIDIQRRVVNQAITQGDVSLIVALAAGYCVLVALQGLIKMTMNISRSWVSETAVLDLRGFISRVGQARGDASCSGTEISMLLAESEAVGGFVGEAVAEPALQLGTLLSVMGYLVYIQPLMALIMLGVIVPQLVFVPLMQMAINRRVQGRIITLRETSGSVIGEGTPEEIRSLQSGQFETVFGLNMGVFELKFSMNFLMNFMHQLSVATILGVGGWLVVLGRTDTGTLVAFISGLATIRSPWRDLVNWFQSFSVTRAKYRLLEASLSGRPDE